MNKPYYLRENEEVCQCVTSGLEDEHDEKYECRECNKCCADEPMASQRCDAYEDKATCVQCMLNEGTTIDEIQAVFCT